MGNYTIFQMFENPRRGRQARNFKQMFRKFQIANRLPNRYFPKIVVGCPCSDSTADSNGSKRRRLLLVSRIANVQWPKSVTTIQFYSRQFQFVPGNFNLLTAISILLTAISICSRQFQFIHGNFNFTHGNFNLFTAISIYSRQFQLVHGNFNLPSAISIYSRQFQFFNRK